MWIIILLLPIIPHNHLSLFDDRQDSWQIDSLFNPHLGLISLLMSSITISYLIIYPTYRYLSNLSIFAVY